MPTQSRAATIQRYADEAVTWTRPRVEEGVVIARERLVPALETARDQAKHTYRETVVPGLSAAMAGAAAAGEPLAEEAAIRGRAALAALKGDLPERHRHWPMALAFMGVGVAAGFTAGLVAHRLRTQVPEVPAYAPPTPVRDTAEATPPQGDPLAGELDLTAGEASRARH